MNRSRRRAAVMSWILTAGVLCGAGGVSAAASIGLAAPARAVPAAADETPTIGDRPSDADRRGNPIGGQSRARSQSLGVRSVDSTAHRRSPGRPTGRGSAGDDPRENTHSAESPRWHCHMNWPVRPDLPVGPPRLPSGGGGDSNYLLETVAAPAPPPAQFPDTTGRALPRLPMEGLGSSDASGGTAFPESPVVAPATSPSESARAPSATSGPIEPTPLAGLIAPPAAPASRLGAGARPPEVGRVGYPNYLREADIAEVAALALPGVAGLLGITAFGGFLGFRQAKAGYALPAGGIARFLQ